MISSFVTRSASGILCLAFAVAFAAAPASAGGVGLNGIVSGDVRVPVTSVKEARFKTVIKQQYDFSCGSAALASLLTFHYDRPTTEEAVFEGMFEAGDQELIQTQGFSLLDMKSYLATVGLDADGFRVPLASVAEAAIPVIALIETRGYRHFVVIKGVSNDEVLIGDPAFGVSIMKRSAFEPLMVTDVVFVIRDEYETGLKHFNERRDWAVRATAPFGSAMTRQGLASFTLHFPGRYEL